MAFVTQLPRFSNPGHCIMFAGRRRDDRGFYLFDNVLDGPGGDLHVGISAEGLRTIAEREGKRLGIVKAEQLEQAREDADALRAEVLQLRTQVEELQKFKDQTAGLVAEGFVVRKKLGRPTTKDDD
jgi:hypothetical protein